MDRGGPFGLDRADAVVDLDRVRTLDLPAEGDGSTRLDLLGRGHELLDRETVGPREIVEDAASDGGRHAKEHGGKHPASLALGLLHPTPYQKT
jgi:hypothetical protein